MNKLKKTTRRLACALVVLSLVASFAFAAEVLTGFKETASEGGYTYTYYPELRVADSGTVAGSFWVTCNSSTVPANYYGARANLYNAKGALVKNSDVFYNARGVTSITSLASSPNGSNQWSADGDAYLYNGSYFVNYNSMGTPVPPIVSRAAHVDVKTNENGEICGSKCLLKAYNIAPDLITAVGDNDVEGYVKAVDLDGNLPSTPEEAAVYTNNLPATRQIPLYSEDGVTIIGTFTICNSDTATANAVIEN